uniref:Uncharacterized protein n=1 Tax=Poecilia mexicana TaxID=48701 RepID=A0A3B3YYW4_9TELE
MQHYKVGLHRVQYNIYVCLHMSTSIHPSIHPFSFTLVPQFETDHHQSETENLQTHFF